MPKPNYLVSVFVNGKQVNSYFSENLDDLVTIKALHKHCDINICDLCSLETFSPKQVEIEIQKSGERWKKSIERPSDITTSAKKLTVPRGKTKKYWERPVRCVETGQVFSSIKACSERIGISHKSIWNAINSKKPRLGLHFENATL